MILLFFILWVMFAGELTVRICVTGAAVSALLWLFGRKVLGYRLSYERLALRKLTGLVVYLGGLLWEMLKAGFVVMKLIYTRGRHMEPRLIWFQTPLRSDGARATLANSITLTAGTITVTLEDGTLCVHALDKSLAEGVEDSLFARRLKRLEE